MSTTSPVSTDTVPTPSPPGPFPLSSVQRVLLLDPYISRRVVTCCVEITPAVPSDQVLDALDVVLRIHPGLTTRMRPQPGDDGTWMQTLEPVPAREIVELRAHAEDGPAAIILREIDALRLRTLDPREAVPTRGSLTPTSDGFVLVLGAHHLIMDALSRQIVVAALDRALRGEPPVSPAPPPDGIRGIVESELASGRRQPTAAATAAVERALSAARPFDLGQQDGDRNLPADRVSFWLDPAQYAAFHDARAALGVTSYTALLSGFFLELGQRGGSDRPAVMTVRTRRVGRLLRSLVGTFADAIVLVAPAPITPSTTVASIADDVGSVLFRGLAGKDNLPDLLPVAPSLQRYLAGDLGPVTAFQYIDITPPPPAPTGPRARSWYRAETECNFDGMGVENLHIICTDHGDGMEIAAWYPPGSFSEQTVLDLLNGFVSRTLHPADAPSPH